MWTKVWPSLRGQPPPLTSSPAPWLARTLGERPPSEAARAQESGLYPHPELLHEEAFGAICPRGTSEPTMQEARGAPTLRAPTGALHVRSRQNSHSCSVENVTLSCSHLKEVSQTLPKATRLDRVRTPSHQFCPPHPKHRGQVSGRQAGAESQLCRSLAETCLPS